MTDALLPHPLKTHETVRLLCMTMPWTDEEVTSNGYVSVA
jgi:hypothetical protein